VEHLLEPGSGRVYPRRRHGGARQQVNTARPEI
jgi:hypothetical protein